MSRELPVALFVPPEVVARPPVAPRSVPRLPASARPLVGAVPGMAGVDHSGRVRDTVVLAALG